MMSRRPQKSVRQLQQQLLLSKAQHCKLNWRQRRQRAQVGTLSAQRA